jgi:hypothetical protein
VDFVDVVIVVVVVDEQHAYVQQPPGA